jgi:hypothetical protein
MRDIPGAGTGRGYEARGDAEGVRIELGGGLGASAIDRPLALPPESSRGML